MKSVEINVNGKPCKRCGNEGQVNETGLCMKCIADDMHLQLFGEKSIAAAEAQIRNLLETWQDKINGTLVKNGGELPITLTVGIERVGRSLNIQTAIAFVSEKIKDRGECSTVSEDQGELFKE